MSDTCPTKKGPQDGDAQAAQQLLVAVYEELRRLAAGKMANEAAGHTLQPTALVHEAWLRLAGQKNPQFQNRSHFFAAAAEAMRRILIEHARRKTALRHGGGQSRVILDEMEIAIPGGDEQLLLLNDALDKFAALYPIEAEVVKLRYFVGLTNDEAAETLDISVRTAKNYWTHARAWLFQEISTKK
jgi:RNA polymerase sigma factor (TIGR02999 family)